MSVTTETSYSIKIDKATQNTKVGVVFAESDDGSVLVSKIKSDSLVGGTALKPGDKIISINGTTTEGLSARETATMLRSSSGPIDIVAEGLGVEDMDELTVPEMAPIEMPDVEVEMKAMPAPGSLKMTIMIAGLKKKVSDLACCGGESEPSKVGAFVASM